MTKPLVSIPIVTYNLRSLLLRHRRKSRMVGKKKRALTIFLSETIYIALASGKYDEADYIRSYNDFVKYRKE